MLAPARKIAGKRLRWLLRLYFSEGFFLYLTIPAQTQENAPWRIPVRIMKSKDRSLGFLPR